LESYEEKKNEAISVSGFYQKLKAFFSEAAIELASKDPLAAE
jgi:hypothetical protein